MSLHLGIDVGTTKIAALVLDASTGQALAVEAVANDARLPSAPGRSEWSADRMVAASIAAARGALERVDARRVTGVGVTGQMHGVVLIDGSLRPLGPFVGWQDERCNAPDGGHPSTIAWMSSLADTGSLVSTGCRLASGFLGATLFWLSRHDSLPAGATAAFIADYLVARLADRPPATDPTNAAGSGLFDVARASGGKISSPRSGCRGARSQTFFRRAPSPAGSRALLPRRWASTRASRSRTRSGTTRRAFSARSASPSETCS